LFAGRKIKNRYITECLIYRGSVSAVYVVSDLEIPGRKYILKEIVDTRHKSTELKLVEFLFLKEVESLKKIKHDNIARVYDGFVKTGRFYILMEYIEGISLDQILEIREEKEFAGFEAFDIFTGIIDIVAYLNSIDDKVKVFRDIKPGSFVLSSTGHIIMVDHGLSQIFLPEESLTSHLKDYNSPEVIEGGKYDEKSDVYALGATMYYILTGMFPGEFQGEIPKANKYNYQMDPQLVNILQKCLSSRKHRFESPEKLGEKIDDTRRSIIEKQKRDITRKQEREVRRIKLSKILKVAPVLILVFIIIIPFLFIGWRHLALKLCEKNFEKIRNALKLYATDNNGNFPDKLAALTPKYLKKIPICPGVGKDAYSSSYRSYNFQGLRYCRLYCSGENHRFIRIPPNFPRFNTYDGVILKPEGEELKSNPVEILLEAYTLDSKGKYEESVRKFRDLTVMEPKLLRERAGIEKYIVFWNMARGLEKMNRRGEALEKYKSAARLLLKRNVYRFNKNIILGLIRDLRRLGHIQYALHFYNTLTDKYVLEREKPDVRIVSDMVDIYENIGRKKEAVKLLRKYYNRAASNDKVFVSAEIYRLKGLKTRSKRYYKRYMRLTGQKPMYEKAAEFK